MLFSQWWPQFKIADKCYGLKTLLHSFSILLCEKILHSAVKVHFWFLMYSSSEHLAFRQRILCIGWIMAIKCGQYEMMQKSEKWLKPWHMVTHLTALSESFEMTWQGLHVFQKSLCHCALDEISLSIGRVKMMIHNVYWH